MNIKEFFKALKDRKIYQVALTYGVAAWLIAQILSLVTDTFNAPDWLMQVFLVLLLLGFPVALALAWAQELSRSRYWKLGGIAILLATTGYFLISRLVPSETSEIAPSNPGAEANSLPIAMLPLINLSEDEQLAYFSTQVTNDIINELAKVRTFAVSAFSTIYSYDSSGKLPQQIAEELGVTYLLQGSARAFAGGDSTKIDVELVDPFTGRIIWQESYLELMDEAPALQAAIARRVAANLNVQLSPTENASLKGAKTENGAAYLKFLQARQEFQSLQPKRMSSAIALLEEVVALDPKFAEAHTLLAWALTLNSWPAFRVDQNTLEVNKGKIQKHIERSLEINPASSDTYLVKANYALSYEGKLAEAVSLVEKAIALNSWPELPTTLCICTAVTVNVIKGNLDRAKEITSIARKVEPGNIFILNDSFFMSMVEGDMDAATSYISQALQLMDVPIFQYQTGWAHYHRGDYTEAISLLKKSIESADQYLPAVHAYLSNSYFQLGDMDKSNRYRDSILQQLSKGQTHVLADLATVAAARGQDDQALTLLERHQKESVTSMAYQLNIDPIFKRYYNHPRFIAIRKEMGYFD